MTNTAADLKQAGTSGLKPPQTNVNPRSPAGDGLATTEHPKPPGETFTQVGWWIPGSLKPGWQSNFQANFVDMANKFGQLGIQPLVKGLPPLEDLGFYFSMAEFDFIQLLTVCPPEGRQFKNAPKDHLVSTTIVAYSVWISAQGWSALSPIPLLTLEDGPVAPSLKGNASPSTSAVNLNLFYPAGWYLTGSLGSKWYDGLRDNLKRARDQRVSSGLQDLSPFYFCQSSFYDCVQMVRLEAFETHPSNAGAVQQYVTWFSREGFGNLRVIPFMAPDLVKEALLIAGKTP